MNKDSIKFPAVITTKEILGIEIGTVLRFDWSSGKYVSLVEEEDIADDYYYSGYAIAIDPYLVKDNIGEYFAQVEQESEKESEPETQEEVLPEKAQEEKVVEEIEMKDAVKQEGYTKTHPLIIDCSCGHRRLLDVVQAPGLQFTIVPDEKSYIELHCNECGASLKLWFAPEEVETNEHTEEETK